MREIYFVLRSGGRYDLKSHGAYKHIESPDYRTLLVGCAIDEGPLRVYDLAHGELLPDPVRQALLDPHVVKYGWSGMNERICLSKALGLKEHTYLPPQGWRSLRAWACSAGYPNELRKFLAEMGCGADCLQDSRRFYRKYCAPGASGLSDDSDDDFHTCSWDAFVLSVKTELQALIIAKALLEDSPVSCAGWMDYVVDQIINDRGVMLDTDFVQSADEYYRRYRAGCLSQFRRITGMNYSANPDSFKEWLHDMDIEAGSLSGEAVERLRQTATGAAREALEKWRQLSKTAPRKYRLFQDAVCSDGRIRGLFEFRGGRSGRYRGALTQLDNLPNCRLMELECAREAVLQKSNFILHSLHEPLPDVLSDLLTTAFIPAKGKSLLYLERPYLLKTILDWLSRSACSSPGKPNSSACEDSATRATALPERAFAEKALTCVENRSIEWTNGIVFECSGNRELLTVMLPSGRELYYRFPQIEKRTDGSLELLCREYDSDGCAHRRRLDGGRLALDIAQGIERDLLADCLARLESRNIPVVMHFHNSVLIEVPAQTRLLSIVCAVNRMPGWAQDLRTNFRGFFCPDYYSKTYQIFR